MKILDIDLDFFLNHAHMGSVTEVNRLEEGYFKPWEEKEVENFLESQCGLTKSNKTKGKLFIHHDEVFYFLRELQEESGFSLQFSIDHVDAHADLGNGDASYIYIATEILGMPLKKRAYPEKKNGSEGLSAGNYLAFMAACRWINNLNYINEIEWTDDTQWFVLKNFNFESDAIQLKQFSKKQMNDLIFNSHGEMQETARLMKPISEEPEIPFQIINKTEFKSDGKYDYIFLTQSPGFTPLSSDSLIPVIKSYMKAS